MTAYRRNNYRESLETLKWTTYKGYCTRSKHFLIIDFTSSRVTERFNWFTLSESYRRAYDFVVPGREGVKQLLVTAAIVGS